jgi:dolichol-phosphate mannosyltransferase
MEEVKVSSMIDPRARAPKRLSIIIPAYNEEDTILEALRRVEAVKLPLEKEIIVVDDGSTDCTRQLLLLAHRNGGFRMHLSPRNQGKGASIRTGFSLATGDLLMVQDADLELDPEDYPALLAPILAGQAEVVYGSRFSGRPVAWTVSYLGNRLMTWLGNFLYGGGITDLHTCYKVFRREIICNTQFTCKRFEFEAEVTAKILRLGHEITEVPISYFPRTVADGKKVRAKDAIECIHQLLKWRFANFEQLTIQPAFGPAKELVPAGAELTSPTLRQERAFG